MILWQTAITDRTQSDVDKIKDYFRRGWSNLTSDEQSEWLNGLKGALNRSDLERIESNIQLLSDVLEIDLQTYYDNIPKNPNNAYFACLLSNVEAIRNAYCIHADTPKTPTTVNMFTDINDIEKILLDVYEILINNFYYYCGDELYMGDETGLLL